MFRNRNFPAILVIQSGGMADGCPLIFSLSANDTRFFVVVNFVRQFIRYFATLRIPNFNESDRRE